MKPAPDESTAWDGKQSQSPKSWDDQEPGSEFWSAVVVGVLCVVAIGGWLVIHPVVKPVPTHEEVGY